ncbi:MAG: recombination mediator RecR [Oligoflexia bacterium]|nr:recombination mediator RecR [Oligoflexia bacterium]
MAFKIPALDRLIEELSRLPGLGEKTAQRLTFHILKSKKDIAEQLSAALLELKSQVKNCPQCFSFTDQELCAFCKDTQRQPELVCVVEDPSDILRIEAAMQFKGRYHVLQGVLSPLDGIGPDQIRLQELLNRLENEKITEVILALDADLEGDATSLYLTKLIKPRGIRVTRIAHGVPIGGNLEYVDYRTLSRALENRVEL